MVPKCMIPISSGPACCKKPCPTNTEFGETRIFSRCNKQTGSSRILFGYNTEFSDEGQKKSWLDTACCKHEVPRPSSFCNLEVDMPLCKGRCFAFNKFHPSDCSSFDGSSRLLSSPSTAARLPSFRSKVASLLPAHIRSHRFPYREIVASWLTYTLHSLGPCSACHVPYPALKIGLQRPLGLWEHIARSVETSCKRASTTLASFVREQKRHPKGVEEHAGDVARICNFFQHGISPRPDLGFAHCKLFSHDTAVHPCEPEVPLWLEWCWNIINLEKCCSSPAKPGCPLWER